MTSSPAFVIKQAVGALLWSPSKSAGEFASLELSEVVMNTQPALELLRSVGSDGFSMLFTLAASASVDESGQLVVVGGVERLRSLMNWKRDKAQRVFRELLEAGFVARSQGSTIGNDGRRHFVATVLVLHPHLYQPSAHRDVAEVPVGTTGTDGSAAGFTGTGRPRPNTATGGSGTDDSGSGDRVVFSATGEPGSGDVPAARTADAVSGTGEPRSSHVNDDDDDEKDHSSSDPVEAAALVTALRSLGFADADRIVEQTERAVLVESLHYVLTSTTAIGNPGAYLRRLLRTGGVRRPDREQLALALASTMQSIRVAPTSHGDALPQSNHISGLSTHDASVTGALDPDVRVNEVVPVDSGFDPERLDAYLADLSPEERIGVEVRADQELEAVPEKFRRHASVFAAMRRYQLARIAGLVDDDA